MKSIPASEEFDERFDWFSVQMGVTRLPADRDFIPLSHEISFSDLLESMGITGATDERSLRLGHIGPEGAVSEQPVQFISAPPEHRPDKDAPVRVAGELCWIARSDSTGQAKYLLWFGVPKDGVQIRVPYGPHHLRGFDSEGRATPVRWHQSMQIRPQWPVNGAVNIYENKELVTSYRTGPTLAEAGEGNCKIKRPFMYPLNGPDGISLTEFGKSHDPTGSHAHHYSLFVSHAAVNKRDFWSERSGELIVHRMFSLQEDGPILCRLVQRTHWLSEDEPQMAGERTWTFHRAADDFRLMDVELRLESMGDEPVELGKTNFGFLAARMTPTLNPFDGGGEILNSRGDRNEQDAHEKQAEWIDQSGPIAQDRWAGLAMFDHPSNPRHPTFWHCRNDGWAGASFCFADAFAIEPDQPLILNYRLHLHRHDSAEGEVAGRYEEYEAEPIIKLGKPQRK